MRFVSAIRTARKARGWTQRELAQRLGVRSWTVESWETGRRHPTRPNLVRLSTVLGISASRLAGLAIADAAEAP